MKSVIVSRQGNPHLNVQKASPKMQTLNIYASTLCHNKTTTGCDDLCFCFPALLSFLPQRWHQCVYHKSPPYGEVVTSNQHLVTNGQSAVISHMIHRDPRPTLQRTCISCISAANVPGCKQSITWTDLKANLTGRQNLIWRPRSERSGLSPRRPALFF